MGDHAKYYIQDARGYVGNDMLWWREGGGYTTSIIDAEVFSQEKAFQLNKGRCSDVPWPKDYIDCHTRMVVDVQIVDIIEALKGTGMKLAKEKRRRKPVWNCRGCGKFINEYSVYNGCPHCGADNCP